MDFLQSLLPAEWLLKLFKPDEDSMPGAHIYLHVREDDVSFRFKNNVTRYDVVEFLKELHDDLLNGNHNELFKQRMLTLFLLDTEQSDSYFNGLMEHFRDFKKTDVIFMKQSSLRIEHEKMDDSSWLTSIYKTMPNINNESDNKAIAVITTKDTYLF